MNAVFFYVPLDNERDKTGYFRQLAATLPVNQPHFRRTLLYTSRGAAIPEGAGMGTVVRLESNETQYPHYMRVVSWLEYLESSLFDADSVFLDADVVLNRSLDDAFREDFSLAFSAMPSDKAYSCINTGVILARHARKTEAISIMRQVADAATRLKLVPDPRFPMMKSSGRWGLDELCLNHYFEERAREQRTTLRAVAESIEFDEIRCVFGTSAALSGEKFNTDARYLDESLWHRPSGLHFPGQPKDKLYEYCASLEKKARAPGRPDGADAHNGGKGIVESGSGSLIAWVWRLLSRRG
jgi:hypothetical protein